MYMHSNRIKTYIDSRLYTNDKKSKSAYVKQIKVDNLDIYVTHIISIWQTIRSIADT